MNETKLQNKITRKAEILIIEDDPDIASLIARELHKFRYSVEFGRGDASPYDRKKIRK